MAQFCLNLVDEIFRLKPLKICWFFFLWNFKLEKWKIPKRMFSVCS